MVSWNIVYVASFNVEPNHVIPKVTESWYSACTTMTVSGFKSEVKEHVIKSSVHVLFLFGKCISIAHDLISFHKIKKCIHPKVSIKNF